MRISESGRRKLFHQKTNVSQGLFLHNNKIAKTGSVLDSQIISELQLRLRASLHALSHLSGFQISERTLVLVVSGEYGDSRPYVPCSGLDTFCACLLVPRLFVLVLFTC